MSTPIHQVFNTHMDEFIQDIQQVLPDNVDIESAKTGIASLRKANPKLLAKLWRAHMADVYSVQIESGDISFFLERDYTAEVEPTAGGNANQILSAIERLRNSVRHMGTDNQAKAMQYIQNLSVLCKMVD